MPEDQTPPTPTSGEPPAGASVTPQPQAGATPPPEPPAGDGTEQPFSLEEARKLRKENQALRARQKTIDEAEEAKRLAALSDVEKANKRAADLEQKYNQQQKQLVNAHVKLAAQTKGIIDPELAALAIADKLEYDENGMPSNVEKALDDLVKAKPYLAAQAATTQPAPPPAQTALFARPPQTPANNPGRSTIQQPGQLPQGRRPKLSDLF